MKHATARSGTSKQSLLEWIRFGGILEARRNRLMENLFATAGAFSIDLWLAR
jgi:hypothetical protein